MSEAWTEADIPRLNPGRITRMRALLEVALAPTRLEITDDSHRHAGHAGSRTGQGHFTLTIVSPAFVGKPLPSRHRLVFAALCELLRTDIHALSIHATTPVEAG